MAFRNTFIPYRAYWSSAFCRWQGALANSNSLELVAATAKRFLHSRQIEPGGIESLHLGFTVPQKQSFYGAPWVAAMAGLEGITGPVLAQACATSARVVASAAGSLETGSDACILALAADRTSNGPQLLYPNPKGIGGMADVEAWVWDNFNKDPNTGQAMLATAENVAQAAGITREEQDELTLLRNEQYQEALRDDRAFQRRYMFPVEIGSGKHTKTVDADEGVFPTTREGLAKLRPVREGGTVTFGGQTYPADGHAGMVLCTEERAASMSADPAVRIQVLASGTARVEKAHMPMAVVPAAERAVGAAGIKFADLQAIKTHNPFAVNDLYFSKKCGIPLDNVNRFGSPLIYGHPQGPTGMRVLIELIEQLVVEGGGYGLFSGCAAGDTAMALVVRVG
ncbi:MAG: thiolase family protein [Planctomycetes bacterium]|nr:thiolase family protein [Planctomycetota bacterium]MCB9868836.1 thiolase family protein [Planctomycetota bacterium]MCB9889550.1 thiolase family protein [Planctomycetota bacterium]